MDRPSQPPPARVPGRRFLHAPGPTPVPDEVLDAMHRQPMDMADPRLDRTVQSCEDGLKRLLGAQQAELFMYACNGHGVWEAVVQNLVAPDRAVLIPGTGHFSESWAVQTEALGRRVVRTPWRPGHPIDADAVEQALRADTARVIVAVLAVHTDTASGITSDLAALRRAIDACGHPALLVVDAVASLAAEPLEMAGLPAEVIVGASQKGLMVPPGLAFVAIDARAADVARANPTPRYYWDWARRRGEASYRKFCGTAPQTLLFGLDAALDLIFREGLAQVQARHRLLAGAVHAAVEGWREGGALDFHAQVADSRSRSVTAVQLAPGFDPEALRTVARERFQVAVAGGLGPLAGKVFRIGHLGDLNPAMILGCLAGLEVAMRTLRLPVGPDGLARAVAWLAGPGGEPGPASPGPPQT